MDLERFNCYSEDATIRGNLQGIVKQNLMDLDFILRNFKNERPELIEDLVNDFQNRLQNIITKEYDLDQLESEKDLEILANFPTLLELSKSAILSFLNISDFENIALDTKPEFQHSDLIRAWFSFRYYLMVSLASILPREKGIEFLRNYIDNNIAHYLDPRLQADTIEEFAEKVTKQMVSSKAYNFTVFKQSKGVFTIKFEKCKWHQVMKELEDQELAYYIPCYGDFRAAQFYNENFILTRTQTLMEGRDYCDFCWHDTRIDKRAEHPPKEFWDNL
ncbi:MAG: L-2-amino-thiazoline-4-carboxylic acid hydrolase [Candidatus Hodarchaeota archaeon]